MCHFCAILSLFCAVSRAIFALLLTLFSGDGAGIVASVSFNTATSLYTLVFKPTVGGVFSVAVTLNNNLEVPPTSLSVYATVGGECTGFSDPINQGQEWVLTCYAFDVYGRRRSVGNDAIQVIAEGATIVIVDLGDGSYTVTYSSSYIGGHEVVVLFNNKECTNMPLNVVVIPGAVVLGTVIPAIFIAGLIIIGLVVYFRRRKQRRIALLKRQRKPEMVFPVNDYEEEWEYDGGDQLDQEEEWFIDQDNLTAEDKLKHAHTVAMREIGGA